MSISGNATSSDAAAASAPPPDMKHDSTEQFSALGSIVAQDTVISELHSTVNGLLALNNKPHSMYCIHVLG